MLVCLSVKMFYILVLCRALLAAEVLTLSIDSQLGTSIEDCFERISIGEQLSPSAIYRNVSELTTRECEQICKQDKQCQTYDYGVGAKGNATCNLSNQDEKEIKEKNLLIRHPDYDVYIRRFQCEQSPPTPLQPQFDDPGDGPAHRPVFRPEVDEPKRPLADFMPDLRPFETSRPDYRPYPPYRPPYNNHIDERPDDYNNLKPDFDRPPSYGVHKPQDIPYRPEKPPETPYRPQKPQDTSYRPEKPHKPDPYDVLQFQDQYGRPPRPQYHENWRPDPHYPQQPIDDVPDIYGPKPIRPNRPEIPYKPDDRPQYQYINRPTKKPRPPEDTGYNKPTKPLDYLTKPDPYGPVDPGPIGPPDRPYKPNRPNYDYPYRPYERPGYEYQGQYASSYGQNQYQDNSIYLEIYDPPRPYKPSKPVDDRPGYGSSSGSYGSNYGYGSPGSYGYGGSYSSQNSHSQTSQSHYGTITQLDDYHRPQDHIGHKPHKPSYGSQSSNYVGSQSSHQHSDQSYGGQSTGYGSQTNKPSDTNKPSYGSNQGSYGSNQGSYGSNQGSYGSNQGTYSGSQPSYGSTQNDYTSNKPGYGSSAQPSYGVSIRPTYGSTQESYNQQESHHQSSYGSSSQSQSGYGSNRPISDNKPLYGDNKPSYGDNKPSYGNNKPSYGDEKPYYGDEKPSYGDNKPSYGDEKPSYDNNKPLYGENKPSYGPSRPPYSGNRPIYGDNQPSYDKPSYNDEPPSYGSNQPSKPAYDSNRPDGDSGPSYGNNQPSYGSNRPTYGDNRPTYDNRPSYGTSSIQSNFGSQTETSGYGNQEDNKNTGYGNQKPDKPNQTDGYYRPDVKPVYEYEVEKPSNAPSYIVRPSGEVITSRPVTIGDYGRPEKPGYGREPGPGREVSYKACFRRVLAGRRALRSHVERVVRCERLEDCRRECATERRFHCESFNYRLDPSFRGKGLCELMTKPIEAFDIRRDFVDDKEYDFYEVDRNSLEPHCPETLRGPGLLHSGYLTSKPARGEYQSGWMDRHDRLGYGSGYGNGNYDRRDDRNYGRGRYEDQFYIPYQIGMGGRSNEDQENWGQYGGYYGGDNYYKDRNDYHKSISHWGLSKPQEFERPYYGVRPQYETKPDSFNYYDLGKKGWGNSGYGYGNWKRGRWNVSGVGNGLDYGESNYYKPPKNYYVEVERSEEPPVKDCSSRRRPGMSLGSGAIRRALFARNVVECEAACFNEREFKCVSYSYRYSSSHGSDNCYLSERPYRGLEMSADSGSDVYAMPQDHGCATISHKPWVESECFWHVRSGAAVSGGAIRAALTVAGLGACEAECIRAHAFFCRGFSFRFDSPTIGDDLENCILTSSPPTSLETGRGLRPNAGHELYARGNYGRGCEPALYDDMHHKESGECYLQYDNAAKLIGTAVRGHARVRDEQACGAACTNAPFRCLSFSYNNNAPPDTDNCLLSEIRLFDLQRGVDYEHSADDWLFAFDLFNGQCWRKVHGKGEYEQPVPELPRPIAPPGEHSYTDSGPSGPPGYLPTPPESSYIPVGPPSGPGYKPSYPVHKPSYPPAGPDYLPEPDLRPPGYKPGYPVEPSGSGFKPAYPPPEPPVVAFKPGYPPSEPSGPGYRPGYLPEPPIYKPGYPGRPGPIYPPSEPSGPGYKPVYPIEPSSPGYRPGYKPGYPEPPRPVYPGRPEPERPVRPGYPIDKVDEPIAVSWRHYTVSGFPCRQGTSCAQNQVAGHWACEPEGGEIGSWDYCCAPTHRCGYSEGFHKPWCYVGPSEDQWRPCSEKYYPYHQHNIPHPSQGHRGEAPRPSRPWQKPTSAYIPNNRDRPDPGPYLPEADRRYWDELYKNGPQAYYDKYGNPLPGYTRVPMEDRPYIRYHHNYPRPGGGHYVPVSPGGQDPPVPGGLGVPRYWPVAYLHKGPPPNITYFRYNETDQTTTTTEKYEPRPPLQPLPPQPPPTQPRDRPPPQFHKVDPDRPTNNNIDVKNHRDEKTRNITNVDEDVFKVDLEKLTTTTTPQVEVKEVTTEAIKERETKDNVTQVEIIKPESVKVDIEMDNPKGISGKIDDFSSSIEVLDIEDAKKGEKISDLKTLEAEERQIEAIGRLLASRRGGKLIIEKRSQKDLETKNIAVDKDLADFNFGNRFPTTERRGIIQKVSKDEIARERNIDRSLEVSETTFVRPPRVLSTTENIRKAIINGKVFYDATIREQRDIFSNTTRKPKSLRPLEDYRAPSIFPNTAFGKKKVIRARNVTPPVNPVRKVRRVYRRKYNPDEVRRRLLEREKSMKSNVGNSKKP